MAEKLSNKYRAIVIGGSAGSFRPLTKILASLPPNFSLPMFLCLHRLKDVRNGLVEALSINSVKKIVEPYDKQHIEQANIYLSPANYHMGIEKEETVFLSIAELINNSRPAIDITFESAACAYGENLIGILLSGANRDGAYGMRKVKEYRGLTIVQDPEESALRIMPASALDSTKIDLVLKTEDLIAFFTQLHKYYI